MVNNYFFTVAYHGCMLKNAGGANKIINNTENCITTTDQCLWKHPDDVLNGVKTKPKTKDDPTVGYKEVDKYFASKFFIHRWIIGKDDTFFIQ